MKAHVRNVAVARTRHQTRGIVMIRHFLAFGFSLALSLQLWSSDDSPSSNSFRVSPDLCWWRADTTFASVFNHTAEWFSNAKVVNVFKPRSNRAQGCFQVTRYVPVEFARKYSTNSASLSAHVATKNRKTTLFLPRANYDYEPFAGFLLFCSWPRFPLSFNGNSLLVL